jgi:predicted acyl esterase
MRDGVKLFLNVFRPEERGAFPVVMAFTIYGKDADPKQYAPEYAALRESIGLGLGSFRISECTPFEAPDPAYWVPHGYVVIHVDVRGFFTSEGAQTPFGEILEDDCVALIEWAGTQEWSNGNVGLNGVSYLAICQWYVAARTPPHLKAIVPWEGVSDTYRDVLYHGGVPETAFFPWWASGHQGTPGTDDEPRRSENHRTPLVSQVLVTPPKLVDIRVPALICGSWSDQGLHTRGSIHAYMEISSEHKWLYTHGRGKWSVYHSPEAMDYQRRFFDYFLKGDDNGMRDEPRVRLEVRKTITQYEVRAEDDWPPTRTEYVRAFLDANNGSLAFSPPASSGKVTYDSTRGEDAAFQIRFDTDTEITGHIALTLWVSTDTGRDMDLLVGLKKLDRAGNEVHFEGRENDPEGIVSNGWLRVSHRERDPLRSKPWRPFLKHERELWLEPGQVVLVEIEILPSSTLFESGESLQLVIKGSDVYSNRMHQHKELCNQGRHTIYAGGEHDSHLLLPLIPRPEHVNIRETAGW